MRGSTRLMAALAVAVGAGAPASPLAAGPPTHGRFDFGTQESVVAPGWEPVRPDTAYDAHRGFGLEGPGGTAFDDPVPVAEAHRPLHPWWSGPVRNDVLRDGIEADAPIRFRADLAPGKYLVAVTVGRYTATRHALRVVVNGREAASRLDAWGHVWGSHGGSPTRCCAIVVDAPDGVVRVEVATDDDRADRWRDYVDVLPEGRPLWFLAPLRATVSGIRVLPWVAPPAAPAPADPVAAARATIDAVPTDLAAAVDRAVLLDALAGRMDHDDRETERALLASAAEAWQRILAGLPPGERERSERFWLATVRAEMAVRLRMAHDYLAMLAYRSADLATGLRCYDRYWAAHDLAGGIPEGDPLHLRARLLRARVAHWCWAEGHHRNTRRMADEELAVLRAAAPANRLVRLYGGDHVPSPLAYRCPDPQAPRWARLQHEALARVLGIVRCWVEQRQNDDGELGGGWGDDVEILRGWLPAVLAIDDPVARRGLRRLADGVWRSGDVVDGGPRTVNDVEHGAEPVSDTQPLAALVFDGEPEWLERCMATMRTMRDVWTGTNDRGQFLFRAHHYSATAIGPKETDRADVALNGRAAAPGLVLLWHSGHPGARALLGRWVATWSEVAAGTEGGKPAGFVPGSIRFSDGRPGGYADAWWQTRDYFADFQTPDYTAALYEHMVGLAATSGDDAWIACLRHTAAAVERQQRERANTTTAGTAAWAAQTSDADSLAEVLGKWRLESGDERFDGLLARRGSAYQRFLLDGDTTALEEALARVVAALSQDVEMSTTEVLFTDRVALPGNEVLHETMTGAIGVATTWPTHAVTWEGTGADVAALVERAGPARLTVRLHSFHDEPRAVRVRPWRLRPGRVHVAVGGRAEETTLAERGGRIGIQLPPRRTVMLEVASLEDDPGPDVRAPSPDLALGADAIRAVGPGSGRLRLAVHNVGSAPSAAPVRGTVEWGAGRRMPVEFPALEAPLDFVPRIATAEVELGPVEPGTVVRLEIDDPGGLRHGNDAAEATLGGE